MEKRLLLFLVLTFGLIVIWSSLVPEPPERPEKQDPATGTAAPGPAGGTAAPPVEEPPDTEPPDVEPPDAEPPAEVPAVDRAHPVRKPSGEHVEEVDGPRVHWRLDGWGASLRQAALKEYVKKPGQSAIPPAGTEVSPNWYEVLSHVVSDGEDGRARRSLAIEAVGKDGRPVPGVRLSERVWTLVADRSTTTALTYRLALPGRGVEFEKEFAFPLEAEGVEGGALHLELAFRMKVTDAALAEKAGVADWRFRLTGPAGVTAEPATSMGQVFFTTILTSDRVDPEEIRGPLDWKDPPTVWPEPEDQAEDRVVEWFGVRSRFFGAILMIREPGELGARAVRVSSEKDADLDGEPFGAMIADAEFALPVPGAGESVERGFLFYVGPMAPEILSEGPYASMEPIIDYGMFGWVTSVLLSLLGWIQSVVGNWGVAIIVLTLLVRMAMFPLSRKSQLSMQRTQKKMARVKPKMDAIKEKYKDNKQKQQQELMKIYKEEGIRPPMGCLIMFLQLPIFIGLFQGLRYAVDLRHAGFLWANDLTAPDKLVDGLLTDHGVPLLADPFHLNLFPILMGVSWYLSTALQPKPADPQQQSMQRMMKLMPVFFSLILYNYAAGLALYMVVSSSWSIFEAKVVKKLLFKEDQAAAEPGKPAPVFRKGR